MRQPYFATHAVGALYFLVLLIWYSAEIIMFFRQLGGARASPGSVSAASGFSSG